MRILILGAGALGGLVGAQLTRAGEDVTLLEVNTARARLLAEDGLLISRSGEEEVCVPLNVVSSVDGLAPFDLVFIAVKTYETGDAVRAVLSVCTPTTLFLSLQNGAGNAETLASIAGPERVVCGITYHSIQHAGPRRLQYRAGIKPIQIAPFEGGSTPALREVAETFQRAGFATEIVPNVQYAIWQKLLHNAVINPTSALTGLTCREMLADPDLIAFMRSLCAEIIAVMRAKDIPIVDEEDPFRPLIGSLKALAKNRPSMWQDLSRGKRTEVDALNGAVVREAERMGLLAPHNAAITQFIHSRERQTFLNKEAVVQKLGIVEHRSSPGVSSAASDARVSALEVLPSGALPFESTHKLTELVKAYYAGLDLAERDPRQRVAACSALAPVEIVRAFGMVPYLPEHHAMLIAASGQAARAMARAGADGFSQFTSSAMRCDIGALLDNRSPFTALYGIARPPHPSIALYSTNAGHEIRRWFEFYASHYEIASVGFEPPPASQKNDRNAVNAAADQLLRVVDEMEARTGRTLELSRLSEVVRLSSEASALWSRILDMAQVVPSPLTYFDALVHLAPIVLLRGTQEAVDYYRLLLSELESRVAEGVAAVPNERHRFYWDGLPVWSASRTLSGIFAARGVAVVGSTYASSFALPNFDEDDPIQSLSAGYMGVFDNQSEAFQGATLSLKFVEYGVDAAVFHDCRTSPEASHVRYGLGVRLERLTSIPALVLEADAHDPRLFSAERIERQLDDFIEQHRERFADRLVAY